MKNNDQNQFCTLETKYISTLRAGGTLYKVCYPNSMAELIEISKEIKEKEQEYIVIGGLSNLLVLDGGYSGVVISSSNLRGIEVDNKYMHIGSGEMLSKVIKVASKNRLSGLERLFGIPGTLGGAICMNSGCFGTEISSVVSCVYLFDTDKQQVIHKTREELDFGYRYSSIKKNNLVIIGASLKLAEKNSYDIKNTMRSALEIRQNTQPLKPSLGSIFKKVDKTSAGIFIEGAKLKGYSINDMQISNVHANFIVNNGNGTADEFLLLIEYIEEQVHKKYGIILEREVGIIGKRAEYSRDS